MSGSQSTTAALAAFTSDLSYSALPIAARDAAARAILDNVGCMLGGAGTDLARQARCMVEQMGGSPQAVIAGAGLRTSMPLAAFLNGVQANALDYDDAFERDGKGMGHPGSTVIPAALAAAEHAGSDGPQFIAAVVAGYEVANRVIEAIQPTPARHAQVWGVAVHQAFGAVAAAALLLGLDRIQTLNAFGLAGAFSTVPAARKWNWIDRPLASPKDVVAPPAEAGIRAALLAKAGWQGARDILDGPQGFWVMAGSDRCDAAKLVDGLGTRWTVEELSFKPYPACRWVHAAIEAVEGIFAEACLFPSDLQRIDVGTFEDVVRHFDDRRPATMVDAEFSAPWTIAAAVAGIPKGPDWYSAATLSDPWIQSIADRVHLHVDEEAQARHFSDERKSMSAVTVCTRDGRRLEQRVPVARGGPGRPWEPGQLEAKFDQLATPTLGANAAGELRDRILGLTTEPALNRVASLVGGFAGG